MRCVFGCVPYVLSGSKCEAAYITHIEDNTACLPLNLTDKKHMYSGAWRILSLFVIVQNKVVSVVCLQFVSNMIHQVFNRINKVRFCYLPSELNYVTSI